MSALRINHVEQQTGPLPADHNPFSARCVRPGAIEYLFPSGADCETLIDALRNHGWRGAIVGPHGSGKSTLLHTLSGPLRQAGREIVVINPRSGNGRERAHFAQPTEQKAPASLSANWSENTQLVVDGFEQLGWFRRTRLMRDCRRTGAGVLATAHRQIALPTLLRATATIETARLVAGRLLPPDDATIDDGDIERCFRAHGGNLREALFALYDLYEQRRGSAR